MNNKNNFIIRLISALILAAVALGAIWWLPANIFAICSLLVALLAAWEWAGIIKLSRAQSLGLIAALLLVCASVWVLADGSAPEPRLSLAIPLGMLGLSASLMWTRRLYTAERVGKLIPAMGAVLLLSCCWITISTSQQYYQQELILFLIIVWLTDSAAYAGGKLMGKRKLMPRISPGKTWEGLLCSLLAAGVFAFSVGFNLWGLLFWAAAIWGDAAESAMKRAFQVKDSGNIIPGHGGVLDRLDALIVASASWAVYLLYG